MLVLLMIITLVGGYRPFIINRYVINNKLKCQEYLDDFYNFSKPVMFEMKESVYDSITIEQKNYTKDFTKDEPKRVYTNDTFYEDIRKHYEKFGAWRNHQPKNNDLKPIKAPDTQEGDAQKFINNMLNKQIKKQMDAQKNFMKGSPKKPKNGKNKVTLFFVSPTQMHHMNVYNNIIQRERNATINKFNNTDGNKNNTLPKDIFDDDNYFWF